MNTQVTPAVSFSDALAAVRANVQRLEWLSRPMDGLLDEQAIQVKFLAACSGLNDMRLIAAKQMHGYARDEAYEVISTYSSVLTKRMEDIQRHRERFLNQQERDENAAIYAATMPPASSFRPQLH